MYSLLSIHLLSPYSLVLIQVLIRLFQRKIVPISLTSSLLKSILADGGALTLHFTKQDEVSMQDWWRDRSGNEIPTDTTKIVPQYSIEFYHSQKGIQLYKEILIYMCKILNPQAKYL